MLDVIFCPKNVYEWHMENMKWNSKDYVTWLRLFGPQLVTKIQQSFRPKVLFNALVKLPKLTIKYGVIGEDDLVHDLLSWDDMYIAGRMHKPIHQICRPNGMLRAAMKRNVFAAAAASLLLLSGRYSGGKGPHVIEERKMFESITGISYVGDVRMSGFENPRKTQNIVDGGLQWFRRLYQPVFHSMPGIEFDEDKRSWTIQTWDPYFAAAWFRMLPQPMQQQVTETYRLKCHQISTSDERAIHEMIESLMLPRILQERLNRTVRWSSIRQMWKAPITNGFMKSMRYAGRKAWKFLSTKRTANI
eukprot:TRINITY_DN486_c0_g1_i1.p3 TRINITY_DN486_c0_g1~~TRINITY_DN486_c0_g1_i1.p3  ORF type:complete len:303 (-),score=55.79 TRINITY_DN486_c0_g1_i1:54-962(-)